jgi:hypothetical protein
LKCLGNPINEATAAYLKLSPERQALHHKYYYELNQPQPRLDMIKLLVRMHLRDPDIYNVFRIDANLTIKKFVGPEEGREYMLFVGFFGI